MKAILNNYLKNTTDTTEKKTTCIRHDIQHSNEGLSKCVSAGLQLRLKAKYWISYVGIYTKYPNFLGRALVFLYKIRVPIHENWIFGTKTLFTLFYQHLQLVLSLISEFQ